MTPICELQFELLVNLMACNKKLTVKEALNNMYSLNYLEAKRRLQIDT